MDVRDAQRDVRTTFQGGFAGQTVSAAIWLVSAALATWSTPSRAIAAVVIGGFFIFPMTQAWLRLSGRPASLPKGHPMNALAMQVAFTLPLNLPLVAAATAHRLNGFYPALMIALGTHYLPFWFLYGMWQFGVLSAVLISAGVLLGMYAPFAFSPGAWFTAAALLAFAFVGRRVAAQDSKSSDVIHPAQ